MRKDKDKDREKETGKQRKDRGTDSTATIKPSMDRPVEKVPSVAAAASASALALASAFSSQGSSPTGSTHHSRAQGQGSPPRSGSSSRHAKETVVVHPPTSGRNTPATPANHPIISLSEATQAHLSKKYGKWGRVLGSGAGGTVRLIKASNKNGGGVYAVK
jgi:hypothetical protein